MIQLSQTLKLEFLKNPSLTLYKLSLQVVLKDITNWKVKKTLFGEAKVSADGEAILPPEMLNKILKENELLSSSKTFF